MGKQITFSEACSRFAGLAVNDFTIQLAIQEAVDRIYEMGRYPGTTTELTLEESDFELSEDSKESYIHFNENDYAGAIGFRNASRGWAIVDQILLYRDGVNGGDREFVDLGTVAGVASTNLTITGDAVPELPASIAYFDEVNGVGHWRQGDFFSVARPVEGGWLVDYSADSGSTYFQWSSDEDVNSPDLVTNWTALGDAEGAPIFAFASAGNTRRRYRCPQNWSADNGPYYALMKLEPPVMGDDDIVPIHSVGALKNAIQAVCYEYTGDQERADRKWADFAGFMGMAERQDHGRKRYSMGIDSSLRRHPKQFS